MTKTNLVSETKSGNEYLENILNSSAENYSVN